MADSVVGEAAGAVAAVDSAAEVPVADGKIPFWARDILHERDLDKIAEAVRLAELATEGIEAEVIDVRSLSPIDYETIGASIRKTGRVVIVEEGPKTGGVSAEIAAGIMEHCGDSLMAPVIRVASADVPVPFSPILENAYRPDVPRIAAAARQLAQT